jgi:hypothetical protein
MHAVVDRAESGDPSVRGVDGHPGGDQLPPGDDTVLPFRDLDRSNVLHVGL